MMSLCHRFNVRQWENTDITFAGYKFGIVQDKVGL